MTKTILLTGASGYLGQHLLWNWMQKWEVAADIVDDPVCIVAAFNQNPNFVDAIQKAKVLSKIKVVPRSCDLMNTAAVDALMQDYSFDVCVHTAALSSPRVCEQNPERARAINVPEYLFSKLKSSRIIALSTDQVFDGTTDKLYKEGDTPRPLNVYGSTKLEMERALLKHQELESDEVILLRSSIILGPKAPISNAHDTFFHFCASRQGQETTFFTNEYRNVVGVQHVHCIINFFVAAATGTVESGIYHMGGPARVNRLEMAQAVFAHMGYETHVLMAAQQTNPTSPLDIGMDSSKLERVTNISHEPSTLKELVLETLADQ